MGRAGLFLAAITLVCAATAIGASHPEWGTLASVTLLIFLLTVAIAAGTMAVRWRLDRAEKGRKRNALKVSNSLVGLSSAAILAVYAAGYQRTGSAEDKYAGQTARRRAAAPLSAHANAPAMMLPLVVNPPAASSTQSSPSRTDRTAPSVGTAPKTERATPSSGTKSVAPDSVASTDAPIGPPPISVTPNEIAATPSAPAVVPPAPSIAAVPATPAVPRPFKYKDGTFLGWGYSRHGDIQASIEIKAGQIVATEIARCQTRYPCSWIDNLPAEVVSKQTPDVDIVSGASESSYAFSDAVMDALTKASE